MFEINVVHVKDFGKKTKFLNSGKTDLYVYCGRPSKFSNPFIMENENQRDSVITQFSQSLPLSDINDLHDYCIAKGIKKLNLGCFCSPKRCHCDIIKDNLLKKQKPVQIKFKDFTFNKDLNLTVRLRDHKMDIHGGDKIKLVSANDKITKMATVDAVTHIKFYQLATTHSHFLDLQHNPNCRTYESLLFCMSEYYKKDVSSEPIVLITFKLDRNKSLFN